MHFKNELNDLKSVWNWKVFTLKKSYFGLIGAWLFRLVWQVLFGPYYYFEHVSMRPLIPITFYSHYNMFIDMYHVMSINCKHIPVVYSIHCITNKANMRVYGIGHSYVPHQFLWLFNKMFNIMIVMMMLIFLVILYISIKSLTAKNISYL